MESDEIRRRSCGSDGNIQEEAFMENNNLGIDEPNIEIQPDQKNDPVGTDEFNHVQSDEKNNPVGTNESDNVQQDEKNNPVGTNEPDITQLKKKRKQVRETVLIAVALSIGVLFMCLIISIVTFYTLVHPLVSADGKTRYEYYGTGRVKTESIYDDKGLMSEQTRYDDEGFFAGNSKYHYDENGKLKTEEKYKYDKNDVTVKEYDENKKVFRESRYVNDALIEVILYEYDSLDRKIKESHYSSSDDLKYWLTYQYHEKTGWLTWIKYDASGKMEDSGGYSIPK